jgi:hypothetical protein
MGRVDKRPNQPNRVAARSRVVSNLLGHLAFGGDKRRILQMHERGLGRSGVLDLVEGRPPRGSIAAVAQIVAGALLTVIGLGMIGFVYAMMRERRGRVFSFAVPFIGLIGAVALLGGLALLLTWSGS